MGNVVVRVDGQHAAHDGAGFIPAGVVEQGAAQQAIGVDVFGKILQDVPTVVHDFVSSVRPEQLFETGKISPQVSCLWHRLVRAPSLPAGGDASNQFLRRKFAKR
jgi:hypothetical protein